MGEDYTEGYHTAFAVAPKPAAFLSFFASLYLLYEIMIRNSDRLSRLYHRIVVAMSINAAFQSLNIFWGTWAMPADAPGITAGTVGTCTAQGFMTQFFNFSVCFYYTSLGVYSFVAIKNDFRQHKIRWMEKWIHVSVYAFPLGSSIFLAAGGYFNPAGAWCWIQNYPMGCGDDPGDVKCARGSDKLSTYKSLLGGLPMILLMAFATVMMVAVCCAVRNMDAKYALSMGKNKQIEEARKRRSLVARRQAIVYLVVLYITAMPIILVRLIQMGTGVLHVEGLLAGAVLLPLQGLLNLIVYNLLLVDRGKGSTRASGSSHSLARKTSLLTRCHFGMTPESFKAQVLAGSSEHPEAEGNSGNANANEMEFSIFDGTNASESPWARFLDPDYSSDEEGNGDEENGTDEKQPSSKQDAFCNEATVGDTPSTHVPFPGKDSIIRRKEQEGEAQHSSDLSTQLSSVNTLSSNVSSMGNNKSEGGCEQQETAAHQSSDLATEQESADAE